MHQERHFELFSGALGTLLMSYGLPDGVASEMLTQVNPEAICKAHRAYCDAGANYHKTNTFNANRERLRSVGMENQCEALNQIAVRLARDSINSSCQVVGTIGPTGRILPEDPAEWRDVVIQVYREQAILLREAGADMLLVETMYDLREALVALEACKSVVDCRVFVSLTVTQSARGFLTYRGDASGDALKVLVDAGADVVGVNCTLDSATCATLAPLMRAFLPDVPLIVQPCAGQPRTLLDSLEYPDSPADFAREMHRVWESGVQFLGGCCGTTPAHIAELNAVLANS